MRDQDDLQRDKVLEKTRALLTAALGAEPVRGRVLVVGCGAGAEAGALAQFPETEVVGIDIQAEYNFDHARNAPATLLQMDAQAMSFADAAFDFVYSFHALEHIPDPDKALSEMNRVLKPGGRFVIGTPNAARVAGYIGAGASLAEKIRWNLADWGMRLAGRWRNELGAHAGFTEAGLVGMCRGAFGAGEAVSTRYYQALYPSPLVRGLAGSALRGLILPCVYCCGRKPG